jgi:pseudaminic acid synthase
MKDIQIGNNIIGINQRPYIIAEMSGNHNQSLEKALEIIDIAAETGVDAIKIQTYTADTITIDHYEGLFVINDEKSLWNGNNLYQLYEKAHTPWEWHEKLFKRAKEKGITLFSTPFDETAVDFLESLGNPIYKIASFENTHLPLLKKIAKTKKPVIISTGMATLAQIELGVSTLRENGCTDIILLKCTSSYPASPENSNISTIQVYEKLFNCIPGISDHTLGIGVSVAAVAMGARVIEKHFVIDRNEGGVDAAFSLEPNEFSSLVDEAKNAFLAIGKIHFGSTESEEGSVRFKRSIYVTEDIEPGDTLNEKNIRVIRPGDGLDPKYYEFLIGKKINKKISRGTPLSLELLIN